MSRFLDFLRRIFRIKSPSLQKAEQYAFYKSPEWERARQQALDKMKADVSAADQMRAYTPMRDGMTITTTSNPYSGYPTTYEEAVAMWEKIDAQAAEDYHEFLKKNLNLPQHDLDGPGLAWGGCSIFDEVHEMKPAPLIMSKKPDTTVVHLRSDPKGPIIEIRADGLDAFCYALRQLAKAAGEAAAALIGAARVVTDADLIARYGTDKEIHYITHARKARTRKKYRNRVLRRARRDERRSRHEKNRTTRA